jgi:uncharacterized protein
MKKLLLIFLITPILSFGADLTPTSWVNDFANLLTAEEKSKLETKIASFEKQTDIELTFAIVATLNDRDIESFANELFKKWGVGKKDRNNGLLVVIAPNERQWRVEIGYGLEPFLTDWQSREFGEDNFKPNFKEGNYFKGLDDFTTAVTKHLGSSTWEERLVYKKKQEEEAEQRAAEVWSAFLNFLLFALGLTFLIILFVQFKKKLRRMRALTAAKKTAISEYEDRVRAINKRFEYHKIPNWTPIQVDSQKIKTIENCNYQGEVTAQLRNCVDSLRPHARRADELDALETAQANLKSVFSSLSRLEKKHELEPTLKYSEHAFKYSEGQDIQSIIRAADTLADSHSTRAERISEWASLVAMGAIDIAEIETIFQKKMERFKGKKYELDQSKMKGWETSLRDRARAFNAISNSFADFEEKSKAYIHYTSLIDTVNRHESNVSEQNRRFTQIQVELQDSPSTIAKLTQKLNGVKVESDVSASVKTQIATFIGLAAAFKIGADIYESHDKLKDLLSSGEKLLRNAESEIAAAIRQKEEERRRKKRQQEEEDRRRRDNYASSSSSSWGSSSSSSSSFGGFGGGDSGGGGSSGSW